MDLANLPIQQQAEFIRRALSGHTAPPSAPKPAATSQPPKPAKPADLSRFSKGTQAYIRAKMAEGWQLLDTTAKPEAGRYNYAATCSNPKCKHAFTFKDASPRVVGKACPACAGLAMTKTTRVIPAVTSKMLNHKMKCTACGKRFIFHSSVAHIDEASCDVCGKPARSVE